MSQTLILNADFLPHAVVSWKEAVLLVLTGKAFPLETYTNWTVSSPSVSIEVPSVLLLRQYVKFKQKVKFSRANVFSRDNYQCQYCARHAGMFHRLKVSDLTFDHVLPRALGGETSWENIVTACKACNGKKGSKSLKESGMRLLRPPERPKSLCNIVYILSHREVPAKWEPYLLDNNNVTLLREPSCEDY
jgi:5-methylcytosine-specific restriction endonuclease McrA